MSASGPCPRATCGDPRLLEYIAARGGALTVTRQAILRG